MRPIQTPVQARLARTQVTLGDQRVRAKPSRTRTLPLQVRYRRQLSTLFYTAISSRRFIFTDCVRKGKFYRALATGRESVQNFRGHRANACFVGNCARFVTPLLPP